MIPLVSKFYCSSSEVVFVVRTRPHVINGGGFVVTDCNQKVVFSVDGCGILGKEEELVVRDEKRDALLLLRGKVISNYSTHSLNKSFWTIQNSVLSGMWMLYCEYVLKIFILLCFREGFLRL